MSAIPAAIRRLCLAVDVASYSQRSRPEQLDVQNRLLWTMIQGCRTARIHPARCDRQDSGDGQILILPAGIDEAKAIPDMVQGLVTALHRVNHPIGPGNRIQLRISLGQGAIQVGQTGFVSPAVVSVCRLLDSDELRDALTAKPDSDAAVIVTTDLYEDMVGQGYGGLPTRGFSRIRIRKPRKGFTAEAWLQVPDSQPLLATVPPYQEPADLKRKQLSGSGGLLSLAAATALAWAVFTDISRADHGSGPSAGHHLAHQHTDGHHVSEHDAGSHHPDQHDSPGVSDGHHAAGDPLADGLPGHAHPGDLHPGDSHAGYAGHHDTHSGHTDFGSDYHFADTSDPVHHGLDGGSGHSATSGYDGSYGSSGFDASHEGSSYTGGYDSADSATSDHTAGHDWIDDTPTHHHGTH